MAKIQLKADARQKTSSGSVTPLRSDFAHRAAPTEGQAVRELLEKYGYHLRRESKTQYEFYSCPFHEEPGNTSTKKATNFYVDKQSSRYFCHVVSCGEKGNLVTLEKHFGIVVGDDPTFKSREVRLQEYQAALTPDLRKVFYDHGLNDTTIERFRVGYDSDHHIGNFKVEGDVFVIPYLEGKHPVLFRYYSPECKGPHGAKYWWEQNSTARLFNATDAVGDEKDGLVFIAEGEMKAMLLCQIGYAAVATPGAGAFKDEFVSLFSNAKQIKICFDFDNPEAHVKEDCKLCTDECLGHNPGQEGAMRTLNMLGWRAKNVVLPLPSGEKKIDINDYFVRDGYTAAQFAELALGRKSNYVVQSMAEIMDNPPDETAWHVDSVLPQQGRLLITGPPKAGKSLLLEVMAMQLATGVPFLRKFPVAEPTRVLILDRELSKRSFFDRIQEFVNDRPGYKAGLSNLLVDHEHLIKLQQPGALEALTQLVEMNGAQVIMLDTAYKFMGDIESAKNVSAAFDVLDRLIAATGVAVVLTHHHRKAVGRGGVAEAPNPDQVVGSFLWTGWPNGTVLLNFGKDRIKDPFTTVCSFAAFRDCAPPEPLTLHRTRESIVYSGISAHVPDEYGDAVFSSDKPTPDSIAAMLIENAPTLENDFIDMAATFFRVTPITIKRLVIDVLDSTDNFIRTGRGSNDSPYVLRVNTRQEEGTWESDHEGQDLAANQLSLVEGGLA